MQNNINWVGWVAGYRTHYAPILDYKRGEYFMTHDNTRITEAGVEEFHKLLLEQFLNHDKVYNPLHAGLAFAYHGNQSRIAEMLENRIEKLESNLVLMQKEYANMVPFVPRSALYIIVSAIEHGKTELKLLCNLLDDARNNRLGESGQLITLGIHE
jgi:hypothetical protein